MPARKLVEDPRGIASLREVRHLPSWFRRDVTIVARELIGCVLVHDKRAGIIVETEAYLGPEDLASHARFGAGKGTSRTSVMYGPGGVSYVYLCYGIHEMFNIVTGDEGQGQAVLIRAIAPYVALPDDPSIGRGPGKVTIALGIDRSHDRKDLSKGPLFVARGITPPNGPAGKPIDVATGPRIGVDYAKEWAKKPYRFWWRDHPSVSRPSVSRDTVSTTRKR